MSEQTRMCCDCGLDEALPPPSFRCAQCQHDYEVRLAMKLARQQKQEPQDV